MEEGKTVKKVVIRKPYQVEIEDVEIPSPGHGEILVKAEFSGISRGTEMMVYRGTFPNLKEKRWNQWQKYPIHPGYELAGVVEEVGLDVETSAHRSQVDSLGAPGDIISRDTNHFSVGDRVICLGEHAEYVKVPVALAAKLPDRVSFESSTLAPLSTTAMHAVRRTGFEYGDKVLINGMGVLGILALQHAKLAGASKAIAVDIDNWRLNVAIECGADWVINPQKENLERKIKQITKIGVDAVIEASGHPGTIRECLHLLRDRGKLTLLGWQTEGISFPFTDFYFKEVEIKATRAIGPDPGLPYAYVRWTSDRSLRHSVELIAEKKLHTEKMITHFFSFNQILDVYEKMDENKIKNFLQVLLKWKSETRK